MAVDAKFAADDRDFKASQRDQRICSGVSFGEPLPLASALLISVTIRRDNGTCSPCLSALNHRSSPCTDNQCLQAIAVDQVLAHARRLLDGAAPDVDAGAGRG